MVESHPPLPAFFGRYHRRLDADGRFVLPETFRHSGPEWTFLPRRGGRLTLMPTRDFESWLQVVQARDDMSTNTSRVRLLRCGCESVTIDRRGRLTVPVTRRRCLNGPSLLVVGNHNNIEIISAADGQVPKLWLEGMTEAEVETLLTGRHT